MEVFRVTTDCPPSPTRKRLGDGCYHVFLDVGANIGIHGRFLYEPHLYPDSKTSVASFAREFGVSRENRDYCIFAFEPNPKFAQRHLDLQAAYGALGWRYTPILAGASNVDGNMTFYHTHREKADTELGFNAVAPNTLYGEKATAKTVQIVRLASWILDEIQDRKIPARQSKNYTEPTVVMKLDIEGLEYKVFLDLLTSGALCRNVHFVMGEFHHHPSANHNFFPINVTSDGRHQLSNYKHARELANTMLHLVDVAENCKTVVSLQDDESYRIDPHGFPKPLG